MKPRWTCRCTRAEGRITKHIYGNTADPEERWCSTFVWGADAMDRGSFWDSSKVFCRQDGYAAYDQIGGPKIVHAGCWSHAERYFSEAVQLNPKDPVATPIVAQIDELFAIDAESRRQRLGLEARHALRQEQSRPLLDGIRKQIEAARSTAPPAGALAKACNHTLTLWQKLTRFVEYPELELSNNLAENSMRPVAIGRRNWIHVGSPQAGPKIAAILSVVESCRRLKLPVRGYLAAVLPGLANLPIQRLPDLTPAACVAQHSETQTTGCWRERDFATVIGGVCRSKAGTVQGITSRDHFQVDKVYAGKQTSPRR